MFDIENKRKYHFDHSKNMKRNETSEKYIKIIKKAQKYVPKKVIYSCQCSFLCMLVVTVAGLCRNNFNNIRRNITNKQQKMKTEITQKSLFMQISFKEAKKNLIFYFIIFAVCKSLCEPQNCIVDHRHQVLCTYRI